MKKLIYPSHPPLKELPTPEQLEKLMQKKIVPSEQNADPSLSVLPQIANPFKKQK
jgi:hypothetical protein